MNLSKWLSVERGRGLKLAAALGVSPVLISQWASGRRVPPFERCIPIERATDGEVSRRDLRPDDYLEMWPELAQPVAVPAGMVLIRERRGATEQRRAVDRERDAQLAPGKGAGDA